MAVRTVMTTKVSGTKSKKEVAAKIAKAGAARAKERKEAAAAKAKAKAAEPPFIAISEKDLGPEVVKFLSKASKIASLKGEKVAAVACLKYICREASKSGVSYLAPRLKKVMR